MAKRAHPWMPHIGHIAKVKAEKNVHGLPSVENIWYYCDGSYPARAFSILAFPNKRIISFNVELHSPGPYPVWVLRSECIFPSKHAKHECHVALRSFDSWSGLRLGLGSATLT